jgi:hypothetical protein
VASRKKGHGPLLAYLNSGAPQRIHEERRLAIAHDIWTRLELPLPPSDEEALALTEALAETLAARPATPQAVADCWARAVVGRPVLTELPTVSIYAFVKRYLRGLSDPPIREAPKGSVPIIPAGFIERPERLRNEPLDLWLFGRSDPWPRIAAVVALALVALALLVTTGVTSRREAAIAAQAAAAQARDEAIAQEARVAGTAALAVAAERDEACNALVAAAEADDLEGVINNAERFLSSPPLTVADPRDKQVADLYGNAMLRWLGTQPDAEAREVQDRIETFSRLTAGE